MFPRLRSTGIEVSPKIHHTMGGVMINENAEVISANTHKPIPGLYARR